MDGAHDNKRGDLINRKVNYFRDDDDAASSVLV
jgi:hypothetical protein